jgi:DMSO/TMAO reductase YedYZ molybdopterin-dependent catalytic subunit
MVLSLFPRQLNPRERELADRLPPGQHRTEKWPVLHYGSVARADLSTWDFQVTGLVEQPLRLSYPELQQLPRRTLRADIHCVTGWSLLDSSWEGISVEEVIKRVRLKPEATHVLVRAEQGYTTNLSLEDFLRPENLLADTRNGQVITPEHGWPLRLLVPHLYFWKSAKWVRGFEFMNRDHPGFWESYGYHNHGDPWREERYG